MKSYGTKNHVSCVQHLEVTYAFKKLKYSLLFENLNDAYYIISMPMFAMEIKLRYGTYYCVNAVNRHFERKECFSAANCEVL